MRLALIPCNTTRPSLGGKHWRTAPHDFSSYTGFVRCSPAVGISVSRTFLLTRNVDLRRGEEQLRQRVYIDYTSAIAPFFTHSSCLRQLMWVTGVLGRKFQI